MNFNDYGQIKSSLFVDVVGTERNQEMLSDAPHTNFEDLSMVYRIRFPVGEDILAVEEDYTELEEALQDEIDNIERMYSGYDEYNYDLVEIGHNPYELAALLTVEFEDYTQEEVQSRLQEIFVAQYELTIEEVVEVRTRTETRTGVNAVVDEDPLRQSDFLRIDRNILLTVTFLLLRQDQGLRTKEAFYECETRKDRGGA